MSFINNNITTDINNALNINSSSTSSNNTPTKLINLMENKYFYPIIIILVLLVIVLILNLSGVNLNLYDVSTATPDLPKNTNVNKIVADIFLSLFICLIIFVLVIILLPNFKELKNLFGQISNVTYVIIYTISLIIFFSLIPSTTLNNWAYFIVPLSLIVGIYTFFKASKTDYLEKIDLNYERIKSMIIMFCLITVLIIYYNINPAGLITKYFGHSLLITILLVVFSFLYLIVIITLSNETNLTE